ncbi:MAG: hypothetical protein KDB14_32290 [Planctomycetales bacterium]|nr:hypothetical protein [Planctomycetales bacterium]
MKLPFRVGGPNDEQVLDADGDVVAQCNSTTKAAAVCDALNFAAEWTETVMPMTDTDEEFELVKRLDAALNGGRDE